ncbi:hypothetical protein FRAAL2717 [Frankia alni ACN14a]|uniref:Uncharacterized protein n=1 Tax=Frankia alni (strain DSM 45986 / CECT 9034 / ACN14a) TaxID=326424 RepID=Q0RM89_FRAAA|nr:hypothetical protein FRAAL2717 [Frankia alni ACN14a]
MPPDDESDVNAQLLAEYKRFTRKCLRVLGAAALVAIVLMLSRVL